MDPILRLTMFIARFQRNPWGRTKILIGLAVLCLALMIGIIDRLGYWPDALRTHSTRGHWVYR